MIPKKCPIRQQYSRAKRFVPPLPDPSLGAERLGFVRERFQLQLSPQQLKTQLAPSLPNLPMKAVLTED